MQTVIYADILIFLNSIITLFILLITSDLLKTDIRRLRLFTGSVLGGIFSLIILAPEMNSILVIITRFLISLIVVIVTFKTDSLKTVVKAVILSFIITVLFGGTVSLIMFNFFSENIYVNNGVISPLHKRITCLDFPQAFAGLPSGTGRIRPGPADYALPRQTEKRRGTGRREHPATAEPLPDGPAGDSILLPG